MKYRTLKLGEVLQDGDEYWFGGRDGASDAWWVKTADAGRKLDDRDFSADMRYRRPVKEINFQRLALTLSKAKSIAEVRAIYRKAVPGGR